MDQEKQKWIIDTDPGCDDLFAIMYLLKRKDAEVLLLSVAHGNVPLSNVETNVKKIYCFNDNVYPETLCGVKEITSQPNYADNYHFEGGLGNVKEINDIDVSHITFKSTVSPIRIVELVRKYPGEINLLTIAPSTNLAAAFMMDPTIRGKFKAVYWMGGSLHSKGNVLGASEFNFAFDPIASFMFNKNFQRVVLLPWEPCETMFFGLDDLVEIRKEITSSNTHQFNEKVFNYVCLIVEKFKIRGQETLQICDLYAIIACFNHDVVKSYFIGDIEVVIDSIETRGATKVTYVKEHNFKSFSEALQNIHTFKVNEKIIIEELHRSVILEEMKRIFIA